ncbi:MAG TPA: alpha-amylase/4-alpha-glucanotransferase domain-containing protein [Candidatus Dormibacteraeota bacterium]|nr:alpha-amylase/4-alpha-glucanotransferase domain-containing protein [Candidatus Dormibacteraeota bacterium]
MSDDRLHFLLGIHNHQPVGNFDSVVDDAVVRAYHPFLETLDRAGSGLPLTVHCSGGLLEALKARARPTFDLLGRLAADGRVELLGGGFYEPILALLPDWDKVGQIQALAHFLKSHWGVTPRGMWLAERIWEPQLPRVLREAGVEFVLVDDSHFALAGLDPETLGGYYLTEEQGVSVAVFPINQRLRYLVPFSDPAESLRYLEGRRAAGAVTLVDDGEKFGVWPGTDRLVYGERWLERFLDALRAAPWLHVSTFSRYLDARPPAGRVYLPTAAYTEMGGWALPPAAAAELEAARHRLHDLPDGERLARLLRGGFFRNFLLKYPEIGDAYWKMLRLSRRVHEGLVARPRDPRLLAARERLWQGQANDAYWHGVFGGCYLPHLRRAVKSALIGGERSLEGAGKPIGIEWTRADVDGDGQAEVAVRTRSLGVLMRPARGGSLTELAWMGGEVDVADVLTRRPEAYHRQVEERPRESLPGEARTIHSAPAVKEAGLTALLRYDRFRRAVLLDGLFPPANGREPLDPLDPWDAAWVTVGERPLDHEVKASPREVTVLCSLLRPDGRPMALQKSLIVAADDSAVTAGYRLRWEGEEPLDARWAVQCNLALSAGDAPGRYFRVAGRPSLGSRGRLEGAHGLAMVDEWLGGEVALSFTAPAEVAWAPVETVSLSESGFERIYQGSALLVAWPVRLAPGETWEVSLRVRVGEMAAGAPETGGPS